MFDKNFFSPLSFLPVFGAGIRDPRSGMGKNQDPGSGINIPDPQHWYLGKIPVDTDRKSKEQNWLAYKK
jgi:hypothetical protein